MDLGKIKNLVKANGDKFIFVENGEPEVVVMSFHEYEKLMNGGAEHREFSVRERHGVPPQQSYEPSFSPAGFLETEFTAQAVAADVAGLPVRLEDIRLEDLPI